MLRQKHLSTAENKVDPDQADLELHFRRGFLNITAGDCSNQTIFVVIVALRVNKTHPSSKMRPSPQGLGKPVP